jgi:hypothetical protein
VIYNEDTMRSLTISLPKNFVTALLACIYALGFIITPYWSLPAAVGTKIILLVLTTSLGVLWVTWAGESLQVRLDRWGSISFAVLLIGMFALNFKCLNSGIPWKGDEEFHIVITKALATQFPNGGVLTIWASLGLILYTAWKKARWAIPVGAVLCGGMTLISLQWNPIQGTDLLRYPFINYWFLTLPPRIATLFTNPYHEILYRIVPLLSAILLAWFFQRSLTGSKTPLNWLWGFAVATMPLVFYYSSILYLEMPAVVLMTAVCLKIKSLLTEDFDQIRHNPAWYALVFIGFVKETAAAFLMCFILCRIIASWLRGRAFKSLKQVLPAEMKLFYCILFPLMFYILLRSTLTTTRSFQPSLTELWNISVQTIAQSFVEQFSIFLLFFAGGCILLFRKQEYAAAGFFLSTIVAIPLFFAADNWLYAGYSRFNLFLLPAILTGSGVLIQQIKKPLGTVIVFAVIAINLVISPIYTDGSKQPAWGNYLVDTSEHYYPYPAALSWLKGIYHHPRILFAGLDYPYFFNYYFDKLNWQPDYVIDLPENPPGGGVDISGVLARAERGNFDAVIYQVSGKDIPKTQQAGHFRLKKVIQNQAHILMIYYRVD